MAIAMTKRVRRNMIAPSCLAAAVRRAWVAAILSNIVAALPQLLDDAVAQVARERLPELLAHGEAFLRDRRHLFQEFLPDRAAIERGDLPQLVGSEVVGVDDRSSFGEGLASRVRALDQLRHDRIKITRDLGTALDDRRLELLHDERQERLELIGGARGRDQFAGGRHGIRRWRWCLGGGRAAAQRDGKNQDRGGDQRQAAVHAVLLCDHPSFHYTPPWITMETVLRPFDTASPRRGATKVWHSPPCRLSQRRRIMGLSDGDTGSPGQQK